MTGAASKTISPDQYDAWLFDLDGVVTDTASIHSAAWKESFDIFLKKVADRDGTDFVPFDIETDYYVYVDGKPRYDGVDSFLRSRGIELPWGTPEDGPDEETVCGVGNKKNALFNEIIKERSPDIFDSSVALIRELKAKGVRLAVVSSSKNCGPILKISKLDDLFEEQMDGLVAAERGLPGKPEPDTFIAAAEDMGVDVSRAVVIEDAISGVQAGRFGNFGLVIGIARHDEPQALLDNGADIVVQDMAEITITD